MSGSLNRVDLIGNVARDVEIRSTQNGGRIANLVVATSERRKDRDGNPQEKSEFHRVTVFAERLIPVIEAYVKKGSRLFLSGQLTTRKWTDRQGQERYSTEVTLTQFRGELQLLDAPPKREEPAARAPIARAAPRAAPRAVESYGDELSDSIPF